MKKRYEHSFTRNLSFVLCFLLAASIFYGCCPLVPSLYIGTPDALYLGKKDYDENTNPRSYLFSASIPQLKNALKKLAENHEHEKLSYYAVEKQYNSFYNFKEYFDKQGNENDVCIESLTGMIPFDKSEIYYSFSSNLNYNIKFCCHLVKVDESKTKVDVVIIKEEVFLGRCFSLHVFCLVDNLVAVEPTSIEAYKILLEIGKELNEPNMPQLNIK